MSKLAGSPGQGRVSRHALGVIVVAVLAIPTFAQAYVGPGLGLGAISSVFALVGAVLLGIVGFIWYPFKRLLRMLRRDRAQDAD